MDQTYDRSTEDLGNIVGLEHVNVQVPDQHLASLFYVVGLGLTRDPYLSVADNNMWINVGRSQFHLPTGSVQVLRGHTAIVMRDRDALLRRLGSIQKRLDGTRFSFREADTCVEVSCPWGNRVNCYEHDAQRFGSMSLGIPHVEFDVPQGTAQGITRFYTEIFNASAVLVQDAGACVSRVSVGKNQHLVFRETDATSPTYDGHHIQVYLASFSAPHTRLKERGLVTREDSRYQYRFREIVDPDDNRLLFTVEHEVRSMTHPLFARPLVNRNPAQTQADYMLGQDNWQW